MLVTRSAKTLPPRSTARTPASGAGYRGSNPWGAANFFVFSAAAFSMAPLVHHHADLMSLDVPPAAGT
jgi:hypothetical protein